MPINAASTLLQARNNWYNRFSTRSSHRAALRYLSLSLFMPSITNFATSYQEISAH